LLAALGVSAASAEGAFPGASGKLAFSSERDGNAEIYVANADGSSAARLTTSPSGDFYPAWSPDGKKIAYTCFDSYLICIMNADGSGSHDIVENGDGVVTSPSWSPDGAQIAFTIWHLDCTDPTECEPYARLAIVDSDGASLHELLGPSFEDYTPAWSPAGTKIAIRGITTINADGTGAAPVGLAGTYPDWSPDGAKLVFQRSFTSIGDEILAGNVDGTGETRLTTNTRDDDRPVWSPDGSKIAFDSNLDGTDSEIYVANADGSGRHAVTANGAADQQPDWQPLPAAGYPRPKGAAYAYFALVPAFRPCTAPDRTHGAPLSFPSCASPAQASTELTVGTPDANGRAAKSTGSALFATQPGNAGTSADEADVLLQVNVTDVRVRADLTDYSGQLTARPVLRITDRDNTPHPGGPGPGTVVDTPFPFAVPCAATSDTTIGSTCAINTTADAVMAGAVRERQRTIWELDRFEVRDAGGATFLSQGLFIP
jgi:TolB protein